MRRLRVKIQPELAPTADEEMMAEAIRQAIEGLFSAVGAESDSAYIVVDDNAYFHLAFTGSGLKLEGSEAVQGASVEGAASHVRGAFPNPEKRILHWRSKPYLAAGKLYYRLTASPVNQASAL